MALATVIAPAVRYATSRSIVQTCRWLVTLSARSCLRAALNESLHGQDESLNACPTALCRRPSRIQHLLLLLNKYYCLDMRAYDVARLWILPAHIKSGAKFNWWHAYPLALNAQALFTPATRVERFSKRGSACVQRTQRALAHLRCAWIAATCKPQHVPRCCLQSEAQQASSAG